MVTALLEIAQPIVGSVAFAENESAVPVMQPEHKNVYDMCVEFTKVPLVRGDIDRPVPV